MAEPISLTGAFLIPLLCDQLTRLGIDRASDRVIAALASRTGDVPVNHTLEKAVERSLRGSLEIFSWRCSLAPARNASCG